MRAAANVAAATCVTATAGMSAAAVPSATVRCDELNVVARPIQMTRFRESGRSNEKCRCGSNRDLQT